MLVRLTNNPDDPQRITEAEATGDLIHPGRVYEVHCGFGCGPVRIVYLGTFQECQDLIDSCAGIRLNGTISLWIALMWEAI